MNTRIQAVTAGALAAIAASVAIPALTGAQASPARTAHVAPARPGASQADQLRALERTRLHALVDADTTTAGRLMAGDFQAVTPTGDTLRRTDYLGSVAAGVIDYLVFKPVSRIAVRRSVPGTAHPQELVSADADYCVARHRVAELMTELATMQLRGFRR